MLKPFGQSHRSLWDVIGEQREQQRQASPAPRPIARHDTARIGIHDTWLWLPNLAPKAASDGKALGLMDADFTHDPRLVTAAGHRYPVRRLLAGSQRAEIHALPRALQLLQAMFERWQPLADGIDWERAQVVLFAPTDVAHDPWLDAALDVWPFDYLPSHGFTAPQQPFSAWLPWALEHEREADILVCIAVDSWATRARAGSLDGGRMAGEAVVALDLRRVDLDAPEDAPRWQVQPSLLESHAPRHRLPRKSSGGLEALAERLLGRSDAQAADVRAVICDGLPEHNRLEHLYHFLNQQLPHCEPLEQVVAQAALAGESGDSTSEMVGLALARQAAQALDGPVLVADRRAAEATRGWLVEDAQAEGIRVEGGTV